MDPMTLRLLLGAISNKNSNQQVAGGIGEPYDDVLGPISEGLGVEQASDAWGNFNSTLSGISGLVGNLLSQGAAQEEGDFAGQAAVGGALQGWGNSMGMGFFGRLLSAGFGAASGYAADASKVEGQMTREQARREAMLTGKSYYPDINQLAEGGLVLDEMMFEPVQMDKGEMVVTPEGEIYKSKSKKMHEDMDDTEITDFLIPGSFVASVRREFKPEDYAEDIMGYGYSYYSEDGDYDIEKSTFGDVMGNSKKDISFAKALEMIRRKFPTKEKDNKRIDIFTEQTNEDNIFNRLPYLQKLATLQEMGKQGLQMVEESGDTLIPRKLATGQPGNYFDRLSGVDVKTLQQILADSHGYLDRLEDRIGETHDEQVGRAADLNRSFSRQNALASLGSLSATLMQDTDITPVLEEPVFSDAMFETMSPAQIEQMRGQNFATGANMLRELSTVSPVQASLSLPATMSEILKGTNNLSFKALESNLQANRQRYSYLNKVFNTNQKTLAQVEDKTRELINKKLENISDQFTGFMSRRAELDAQKFELEAASTASRQKGEMNIASQRIALDSAVAGLSVQEEDRNRQVSAMGANRQATDPVDEAVNRRGSIDTFDEILNIIPNPLVRGALSKRFQDVYDKEGLDGTVTFQGREITLRELLRSR